ncbi:hypothetical protein HYW87_00200 [Candidatus Roizmanbacteria bacterium]|nr:hypothetical protein [Candidatus Roizmanbacteria bacterium]
MDQGKKNLDDQLKSQLKKNLVDAMVLGLQTKQLTFKEMRASANFILDSMENMSSYTELVLFLEGLKKQWPVYGNILTLYKSKLYEEKEKILIDKLSTYIKSYS